MLHKGKNNVFKLISPYTAGELLDFEMDDLITLVQFARREIDELQIKLNKLREEFENFKKYPKTDLIKIIWDEDKINDYIRSLKREHDRAKMSYSYLQGIIRVKQQGGKNG